MSRPRPIRDFARAVTLLTAVPVPFSHPASAGGDGDRERADSASYFPLVGLAFGLALLVVVWFSNRFFYGMSGVTAVLIVSAQALATRLLHWDGLADVADGWFVTPERRLDVMSDSAVGAFGAVAVAFLALLQVEALTAIATSPVTVAPVVLAPVFGRLAATFAAWLGKPAREGGLGRSVLGPPTLPGALACAAALALAFGAAWAAGASAVVLSIVGVGALVMALVVPHLVARRFGGVTGDTMGASVLLVETGVLVTILLATGVLRLAGVSA